MYEKILYFDPLPDRERTLNLLEKLDYEVVPVLSPGEVYRNLENGQFDLLISELSLKDLPLHVFLEKIESIARQNPVSHLSVTSTRSLYDISLAETFRVRPILFKPPDPGELENAVRFSVLNRNEGMVLCPESMKKQLSSCFYSMGFDVRFFTRLFDFNRGLYERKSDFIVYVEGFSDLSPVQLLNRMISFSRTKIPIYFFLKKKDMLLAGLMDKYGPGAAQYFPWDFSVVERQLQEMICDAYSNEPVPEEFFEQAEKDGAPEESGRDGDAGESGFAGTPPGGKNDAKTAAIQPHEETEAPVPKEDETFSGNLSFSEFARSLNARIPQARITVPVSRFMKTADSFQKQRAVEALDSPEGETATPVFIDAYRRGNDALREFAVDILADLKPQRAIMECLVAALNDRLPSIQYTALLGLGSYDVSLIANRVRIKLGDSEIKVRQAAATLLQRVRDLRIFADFLQVTLASGDSGIRVSFVEYVKVNYPDLKDLKIFLPVFDSGDTLLKEMLLDFLISQKDFRVLPFLRLAANSGERGMVRIAVSGYRELKAPEGVEFLLPLLETRESFLAESALVAIMEANAVPEHTLLFVRIMDKGDDSLREQAISLVKHFKEKDSLPIMKAALIRGGVGAKLAAIEGMENWKTETAILTIGSLLDDNDRLISDYVYGYIRDRADKSCIENLVKVFLEVKTDESREILAHILGKLVKDEPPNNLTKWTHRDSFSVLIRILKTYGISLGKYTAEVLGGRISDKSSFEVILRTLYHKDPETRAEAAFILGDQKQEKAVPHLMRFLNDENWYVRRVVIEALGKMEAREALPLILKRFRDENAAVRYASTVALQQFRIRFKENLIPVFMEEDSVRVREEMVRLFTPFRDRRTADVYLPRLTARNILTRINAAASLLPLWDNLDRDSIHSWLKSDRWALRLVAISYFAKQEPSLILESMEVFILDDSEEVRKFLIQFVAQEKKERFLEIVFPFIRDDSPLVRRQVALELQKLKPDGMMEFLVEIFRNETHDGVLEVLFDIFDDERDSRIPDLLRDKYDSFNENFRNRASALLENYADTSNRT